MIHNACNVFEVLWWYVADHVDQDRLVAYVIDEVPAISVVVNP